MRFLGSIVLLLATAAGAVAAAAPTAEAEDRVVRRDGRHVDGRVLSVDAETVVVETPRGRVRLPRSDVRSITFGDRDRPERPLKVEIRAVSGDDAVDVLLDGETIIEGARAAGAWIDVTDRLKTGNHSLAFRIHNDRGTWGYQVHLRINGQLTRLECGRPPVRGCDCCGKQGSEVGVIDDLPLRWIWVDRELGRAELVP